VRLGAARLPTGVGWRGVAVVGLAAGVGFTVALFVAGLALDDPRALDSAKLGIIAGSTLAAALAWTAGRWLLPPTPVSGSARTAEEAEQSTER
jgi:NhaA family Na+:H+ antiporter